MKTLAPVTDKHIVTAVNQATMIYPDVDKELLKNTLLANHATQIDDFKILEGRERRMPWLKEFKANQSTDWDFWTRYVMYLKKDKHFPDAVIAHLDALTDEILDHLFNPQMENVQIDKKGLVVGQVQSGKTANYTGLICKAADAGFNFIVVLAGIHNNLRSQTQTRLDEGFLGFDTQYVRKYEEGLSQKISVGCYKGFKHAIANSITTSEEKGDFTFAYEDSLSIEEKIEAVVKKVYGGDGINVMPEAKRQIARLEALGFGKCPVCIAKTQYSFSDDPTKLGAPEHFTVTVKNVKISAGAGFVVVLTGDILTMPGLPKFPAAEKIDVDESGRITGLF